ncbi:MAG: flagellar hook capping FlgD N-terminal domain-containing protein [Dethiobacteria bacterium]
MTNVYGVSNTQDNYQTTAETAKKQDIDKDLFLKLLITQLRYQDPLSEQQDMGEFITQLTLFTLVEQVTSMQNALEAQKMASDEAKALNLLNREVVVEDESEQIVEGVVSSVNFRFQQPYITVNGKEYPFYAVVSVKGGDEQDG